MNIKQADSINIHHAASLLQSGQLVAFPTETVYGLGADATNDHAVADIFAVKGRPQFNPLIIHVISQEMAGRYVRWNGWAETLAARFWPAPLTMILPRLPDCGISLLASSGGDSLGIRIPAHATARALIAAAGFPLAAPSANRSGRISPTTAEAVYAELGNSIPLILDGGPSEIGIESTVIDLSGDKPLLLRPGYITREQLEEALGQAVSLPDPATTTLKSPGQLASHYAPALPVRLDAASVQGDEALLAFGAVPLPGATITLNLSETGDLREAAANLFRHLRTLDQPGRYTGIAIMAIPDSGIGCAINDRLRRAAAANLYPWLAAYPANIRWDTAITPKPLFALLQEAQQNYPDHIAIDFYGKLTRYRELYADVVKLAGALQQRGVGRGTRVGILMPNCPQFIISYYAILMTGATVVNYNPLYSTLEIAHQINDSATAVMMTVTLNAIYHKVAECLATTCLHAIIASDFHDALPLAKKLGFQWMRAREIATVVYDEHHLSFARLLEKGGVFTPVPVQPESEPAVLQYTGGTTGVPKGCILTHAAVYTNTVQCGLWFTGLEHGRESIVGALPFFHVFAMTIVMNLAIHTGSRMLLYPKFDMAAILQDMDTKRPTLMAGVPTMYAAINHSRNLEQYNLKSLKMCISGGGPLPQEVKERFEGVTGCKLVEGYGLSESSPVLCANPLFGVNKSGSIGLPFPATGIRIINPETHAVMPTGQVGEICARGPQVMQGYLGNTAETDMVIKNGFLHTGDLGYMDTEGYVFVVDRLKEMIISGGYKIYPRTIEEVLYQHPDILEAAVIGIPHPQRGQEVKAFIVLKEGRQLGSPAVKDYLQEKISAYAIPHTIVFRASLPKSAIGKILKKMLVEEEKG